MRPGRLRSGEWTALAGAVGLAALLPLRWYELRSPVATVGQDESGLASLGWFAVLILLVAIVAGVALAVSTAADRSPAIPVGLAVVTTALGALATLVIAVRLLAQPGLGVGAPNEEVAVLPAAVFALGAAAVLTMGAWRTMADERTQTPESIRQTERVLAVRGAPRPAPPADAS